MGEMMFAPQCHDQWMGGLGKKRPHRHIMSDADETQVEMRKAMRASMLKARFADTIFKATLELQTGNSCDHVSSLQQIKAASRRKAQDDLKKRRDAQREALRKVEKSVCVDEDAASIMRDFEKLIGLPSGTGLGYPNTKPPERRQRAGDDVEEGEIVS